MHRKLPSNSWVLKQTIELNHQNRLFAFEVQFTPWGEVLEVENFFDLLPESARKLMLGQHFEAVDSKLKVFEKLLRYFVPLAAIGVLEKQQWVDIHTKAKERQELLQLSLKDLRCFTSKQEWISALYAKDFLVTDPQRWSLLELLLSPKPDDIRIALNFITFEVVKLANPILMELLHFGVSQSDRHSIYRAFSTISNSISTTHLLETLSKESEERYWPTILATLKHIDDDRILPSLLAFYKKQVVILSPLKITDKPTDTGKQYGFEQYNKLYFNLIFSLSKYASQKEVQQILLEAIQGFLPNPAVEAFEGLRKAAYPLKEILEALHEVISAPLSVRHIQTALTIFEHIDNESDLPSPDRLVDLLIWNHKTHIGSNNNLVRTIAAIFGKCQDDSSLQRLVRLVYDSKQTLAIDALKVLEYGPASILSALTPYLDPNLPNYNFVQLVETFKKLLPKANIDQVDLLLDAVLKFYDQLTPGGFFSPLFSLLTEISYIVNTPRIYDIFVSTLLAKTSNIGQKRIALRSLMAFYSYPPAIEIFRAYAKNGDPGLASTANSLLHFLERKERTWPVVKKEPISRMTK